MRLSSTPSNNFCKASVNQPTSLQQRQGLTITKEVEKRLVNLFDETHLKFKRLVIEQASRLVDGQPHSRGFAHLQGFAINHFSTILKDLKKHQASNHLILAVDSAVDGVTHTLKVMSPSGEVVYKTWFKNETIGDVSKGLSCLLQELPGLAERNRPMAKILRALRRCGHLQWNQS
ncbi:MAG: hypothetical protein ACK551_00855 [Vampirovibrionales bacterium]